MTIADIILKKLPKKIKKCLIFPKRMILYSHKQVKRFGETKETREDENAKTTQLNPNVFLREEETK